MGTMGYMSPEQVRGLPVDHRSDIFSFGTILYEMLSGKKAFKKATASDTIAAILKEEPPELTQSGRNVSPALDHIVKHCLEKDRDNRFQTAKDVAFACRRQSSSGAMSGASGVRVAAPAARSKVSRRGRGRRRPGRRRFLSRCGVPHGGAGETGGVKRVAVLPFENLGAPEDDYFADGVADEIRGKLTSLPGLQVIARGSSTPYKKTAKTPKQIAEELEVGYLLTATVRWEKSGGANRVHVSPELIEVSGSGAPTSKWQQPFDAAITDVFRCSRRSRRRWRRRWAARSGRARRSDFPRSRRRTSRLTTPSSRARMLRRAWRSAIPPSMRKALGFYEQAVALDPGFAQAWARVSMANSNLYANSTPSPQVAERAKQAAQKAVAIAPNRPEGYLALGRHQDVVVLDASRALEHYMKAQSLAPNSAEILSAVAVEQETLGRWDAAVEHLKQAERLDPQSMTALRRLGDALLTLRRYPEASEALDRGLALEPGNLSVLERKAMIFLGQGDLTRARAVLRDVPKEVGPTALVAYVATYQDLVWVLDEGQRELLLRLTPSAFDDDRGVWAICLAQAYALMGDGPNVRTYAEEARKAFEEQLLATPDDSQRRVMLGLSLAYLGHKEEAIRQGQRGVELLPVAKDASNGPYSQHQLARIYMLVGEPEKALDQLEPLLKIPYNLSPGWLKIDPNFDPLRKNSRFQKLVAGGK